MTEDSVMKIADFGLARDIHHIDYYKKTTNVSGVCVWGGGDGGGEQSEDLCATKQCAFCLSTQVQKSCGTGCWSLCCGHQA